MAKNNLDQFYTNPKIAKECISLLEKHIQEDKRSKYIEPSAGSGSFSSQLKNCKSYDLDPKFSGIEKADFLLLSSDNSENHKTTVIGNPPFGKNSSLAVKFFNHSTKFADVIAFIVPKTFKKRSVLKRLNLNYHLVHEWDLPKKSFIYEGEAYDVPCVFQIWKKEEFKRVIEAPTENIWFDFVKKSEAEAAIRRVGGRTGFSFTDFNSASESSHYFIKTKSKPVSDLITKINSIDFSSIINSTAGVRSLSKDELVRKLKELMDSENGRGC